jgi:hypothetical protein
MANNIEVSRIQARKMVAANSRYEDSTVIYYGENKYITFPLYRRSTTKRSQNDKYTVIGKGYEYRPDLVAVDFYGTSMFWHRILEANGISDIWDFKSGLSIRIPGSIY